MRRSKSHDDNVIENMKKAVAVLVNDIHLDKTNGGLVRDIFDQCASLCEELGCIYIIIGGDVFTNRSGQPLVCLTDWKDIVQSLDERGFGTIAIPGNHDKTDGDDYRSYLEPYSEWMAVQSRGICIKMCDINFVFVPYFREEKWLEEWKRADAERDRTKRSILITHIGMDGVKNNDGTAVESIIRPSMFADYDKVLIGHYHNASQIAKNVFYTGSAYQRDFGENISDKGFTVIYDDASIKFVPSGFPKYIRHDIDVNDSESLSNLLEKYVGERYDHIRFVFRGSRADCQKLNIAEIQTRYGISCKIECDENRSVSTTGEEDVLSYDKKTIVKDFLKFCSDSDIKGERMRYGLELIKNI